MATPDCVRHATNWFRPSRWWCGPNAMSTTWNASLVNNVLTGKLNHLYLTSYVAYTVLSYLLRFCVGDRFYLYENRILCESDYAEKLQLAADAQAGFNNNNNHIQNNNNNHNTSIKSSNTLNKSMPPNGANLNNFHLKSLADGGFPGFNGMRRTVDVESHNNIVVR